MNILDKVISVLQANLTKDEWIEFGEELDFNPHDEFLDKVNRQIYKLAPEVFDGPTCEHENQEERQDPYYQCYRYCLDCGELLK